MEMLQSEAPINPGIEKNKSHPTSQSQETIIKYFCSSSSDLKSVNLACNGIVQLSSSFIMTFSHITNLFLNNNQIEVLPDEIGNLENLQVLALENNKIKALPDSICKLRKLKTLFLHKNKLTQLPNELSQLKDLQKLSLHTNGFVRLPAIFHFFTHLKEISLQWFSYLDPAKDRSVRAEGLGNEIIKKFKMLSRSTHERSLDSFDFDAFARRLSDLSVSLTP